MVWGVSDDPEKTHEAFGETTVTKTQFDYSNVSRPRLLRLGGVPLIGSMFQFKNFPVQWFAFSWATLFSKTPKLGAQIDQEEDGSTKKRTLSNRLGAGAMLTMMSTMIAGSAQTYFGVFEYVFYLMRAFLEKLLGDDDEEPIPADIAYMNDRLIRASRSAGWHALQSGIPAQSGLSLSRSAGLGEYLPGPGTISSLFPLRLRNHIGTTANTMMAPPTPSMRRSPRATTSSRRIGG